LTKEANDCKCAMRLAPDFRTPDDAIVARRTNLTASRAARHRQYRRGTRRRAVAFAVCSHERAREHARCEWKNLENSG